MKISIDPKAGFCFGVRRVILLAEEELNKSGHLFCLGQVVHNQEEENRLKLMGLEIIGTEDFGKLKNTSVLIRAHGEPPETYRIAIQNNIKLIDGTCPIVIGLQKSISKSYFDSKKNDGQVVIFGKKHHPEVLGLKGQTDGEAIIIENENDIHKIDFKKPVYLFAQTTKSKKVFEELTAKIHEGTGHPAVSETLHFEVNDTICRQVTGRETNLKEFAENHDAVIFVGGENSSNGHYLFSIVNSANQNSYYVDKPEKIKIEWFDGMFNVGVTGATSTPRWLLEKIVERIETLS